MHIHKTRYYTVHGIQSTLAASKDILIEKIWKGLADQTRG